MDNSDTRSYKPDAGAGLYRRSMYWFWKRSAPPASMDIFNAPSRENCCIKRERTNTPLQALTLLNDPVYVEIAHAFAARLLRELPHADADTRLRHAFGLAVARQPLPAELAALRQLHDRERAAGDEKAAWFAVATTLLNLDETITKN